MILVSKWQFIKIKLEMERALLDVEHSNELKSIQNDEAKLKHLQKEHQMRLDAFNIHTNQVIFFFYFTNLVIITRVVEGTKFNKI